MSHYIRCLSIIFLALTGLAQLAWADTVTLTTYYPTPDGLYQNLTVSTAETVNGTLTANGKVTIMGDGGLELVNTVAPSSYIDFKGSSHTAADYRGRIQYDDTSGDFLFYRQASANPTFSTHPDGGVEIANGTAGQDTAYIDFKGNANIGTDFQERIKSDDSVGMSFYTNASLTPKVSIFNNGNLEVTGNTATGTMPQYLQLGGQENGTVIQFPSANAANDNAFFYPVTFSNNYDLRLYLQDDQDDTEKFSIWGGSCQNGGCSQGTANAIEQWHVTAAGNGYYRGTLWVNSGDFYSGQRADFHLVLQGDRNMVLYDGGAAIWASGTAVSDIRFKEQVKPIEPVLEKLTQLSVIRFRYKKLIDETQAPQIGVVAQEIVKVFPEFVYHTKEGDDRLLVYYDKLTAVLLKGIQELKAMFDAMNTHVSSHDDTIAQLKIAQEQDLAAIKALRDEFEAYKAIHP